MKLLGYRFHLRYKGLATSRADRNRNELDLYPSMIEWHIRDSRSINGLR